MGSPLALAASNLPLAASGMPPIAFSQPGISAASSPAAQRAASGVEGTVCQNTT